MVSQLIPHEVEILKNSMSALDIKICLSELETVILEAWMGKIYELDGVFLFRLNPPEKPRTDMIIEPGRRVHLTEMEYTTPQHPPSFAMLLRKHIQNTRLVKLRQPDLERIIELEFEGKEGRKTIIVELFGTGNLLLCDENRKIIKPHREQTWKHRELKAGQKYVPPPKRGKDISSITRNELRDALSGAPDLIRGLARNLNIGGQLGEEICARSNLEKEKDPSELTREELDAIYSTIKTLLTTEPSPQILYDDGTPVGFVPFPFKIESNLKAEPLESFNKALDRYFQEISKLQLEDKTEEKLEDKIEDIEGRLKKQKKHLQDLRNTAQEAKKKADAISTHHEGIDTALEKINEIRKSDGWNAVIEKIQETSRSGEDWSEPIESVNPNDGTLSIKLPEISVELDIRKSSFENASKLYQKYKKSKDKVEGAKEAIKNTEKELKKVKEKDVEPPEKPAPQKPREKKWYERYRWFISSDDMLVIAGRDAKTNQEIVEKHMEPPDRYLHADLKGAPHTVIKSEGEKISEPTLKEAARFAAVHSRAWREGLANADVYWVEPEQVTKKAPPGEYLPKGGYMIEGKRNYLTVPLEAAVGLLKRDGKKVPMCGPPTAVEHHSDISIKIKPGQEKKSDLTRKIRSNIQKNSDLKINLDELMSILPPGSGMLVE